MDRYNSVLPTKGYTTDIGARKRVQLPGEQVKGSQSGPPYGSAGLYHSTPIAKTITPMSTTMASSYMKPRTTNSLQYNPSSAIPSLRTPRSKSPIRNTTSPLGTRRSISPRRGTSPSRLHGGSPRSPTKQASDVDTDTIQRQRRELQLLIGELKDRDRELNDMVQSHQKQIVAWEEDRQRVFSLEKRSSRLESELKSKNEQIRANKARLKASEAEEKTKTKELEDTQVQLQHVSEQANTSIHQLQDLEEKNISLTNTMRELSNTIGQLQAREQELSTRLKLKDNDITDANVRLGELQQRIRRLESICQDLKKADVTLKTERDQWKDQALANKNEIERLRGDISKQFSDADEIQAECGQVKQEVLVLQKELFLAGEREKRKDQLLELQKSKQERTDAELQNIRQICERQQRDISFLQMQLQTNQESLLKTDEFTNDNKIGDYYEESINYNPNTDYDNQDTVSTKSLDFDGKGLNPMSNYPTIGSEFGEDLDSVSHEPLPTLVNDRQYASTAMPDSYRGDRQQPYYGVPPNKPDMYPAFGGLTISGTKQEVESIDGDSASYMPYTIGPDLTGTRVPVSSNGLSYSTSTPQANHQADESSPTSKLHRLLAESRQMVENLEQVTSFAAPPSPAKQDGMQGVDQFTPPQRHLGSPSTNHVQGKAQS